MNRYLAFGRITLISLLSVISISTFFAQCFTSQLPSKLGYPVYDVHFLNESTGWLNTVTQVLRTDDGGQTWKKFEVGQNIVPSAIDFYDTNIGLMTGGHGLILKSEDGGKTWFKTLANVDFQFWDVKFITKKRAISVGENGTIGISENEGNNWSIIEIPFLIDFHKIFVLNDSTYQAFGMGQMVSYTTDYGKTWSSTTITTTANQIDHINYINQQKGWLINSNYEIWETNNQGTDWVNISNKFVGKARNLLFFDEQEGLILTDKFAYRTKDGGITWLSESNSVTLGYRHLVKANSNIFNISFYGEIEKSKDRGLSWDIINQSISTLKSSSGNVKFINIDTGFIYANNEIFFRTENGGETWESINLPIGGNTKDLLLSDKTLWLSGDSTYLLKSTDYGKNWQKMHFADYKESKPSFALTNDSTIWLAGISGMRKKSSDGGRNWGYFVHPSSERIEHLISPEKNHLIAVDKTGGFFLTENDGMNWGKTFQKNDFTTAFIDFFDSENGCAASKNAIIVTHDGGKNWKEIPLPTSAQIFFIQMVSQSLIRFWGQNDVYTSAIFSTINDGANWYATNNPYYSGNFYYLNPYQGWYKKGSKLIRHEILPVACGEIKILSPKTDSLVPSHALFNWNIPDDCAEGFLVDIGYSSGSNELLNNKDVGFTSRFQPEFDLPAGQDLFITIKPYNFLGVADGCPSTKFTTFDCQKDITIVDTFLCKTGVPIGVLDKSIWVEGNFKYVYKKANGCDSIQIINVVDKRKYTEIEGTFCPSMPFHYQGIDYSRLGNTYLTSISENGCDSTTILRLRNYHINQPAFDTIVCKLDTFIWRGKKITRSGTYRDTSIVSPGCDSIFRLNLTYEPLGNYEPDTIFLCDKEQIEIGGLIYKDSGNYVFETKTANGCDSVYNFYIRKLNVRYRDSVYLNICPGGEIEWEGEIYSTPGRYIKTFGPRANLCDSIKILKLQYSDEINRRWEIISEPPTPIFLELHFVNNSLGWAISNKKVYRTVDGGMSWEEQVVPNSIKLNDVFFIDEKTGYVSALNDFNPNFPIGAGLLFKTDNGGLSWELNYTYIHGLNSIYFVGENNGWITTDANSVLITTDGAQLWQERRLPGYPSFLFGVFFLDKFSGWVTGELSKIYRTSDGGLTWQLLHYYDFSSPSPDFLEKIQIFENEKGFVIELSPVIRDWPTPPRGNLFKTTDGGRTISPITLPLGVTPINFHFFNSEHGIINCRSGVILETWDGGATFKVIQAPTFKSTLSIFALDSTKIWVSTQGDGVLKLTFPLPTCDIQTSQPNQGDTLTVNEANLAWNYPTNCVEGFKVAYQVVAEGIVLKTDTVDAGSLREVLLSELPYNSRVNYQILPYNANGLAESCDTFFFYTPACRAEAIPVDTTICQGDTLKIRDYSLSTAGYYELTYRGENNCDSILPVQLRFRQNVLTSVSEIVSAGTVFNGVLIQNDTSFLQVYPAANGCDSIVSYFVKIIVGTHQIKDENTILKIIPNPNRGAAKLEITDARQADFTLKIFDLNGKNVWSKNGATTRRERQTIDLDIENLAAGFYWIEFAQENIKQRLAMVKL